MASSRISILSARLPSTNLNGSHQSLGAATMDLLPALHNHCKNRSATLLRCSRAAAATNGNSAVLMQKKKEEKDDEKIDHSPRHLFQYPDGPSQATFFRFDDVEEVSSALAEYIVQVSNEAIKQRGKFTFVLSGGSIVKALRFLAEGPVFHSIAWDKWHVFWVDERVVPLNHEDSNYKLAKDEFLSKVPIPHEQIHAIQNFHDEKAAAHAYESKLRELVRKKVITTKTAKKFPRFDFVLLGLGPDGHVASLFPNRPSLAEEKLWVLPISNSPKPPSKRITMTLPCINAAEHVAFVALGSGKAHVLHRVLERPALPGSLPAQMVRVDDGNLVWFADQGATSELHLENWNNAKQFPFFDFKQPASVSS
ncbi:probable 6-phosphogluconolactonase 1 [Selaginella moellendorffii]|nr:probable 6-phosphogluconolactonase 1 [Selaginella moellendorffii]|eukprot:XP_002976562.2 probable 6-phosphogluconolactonase 1 [Selaginella moellendorffii]